MCVTVICLSVFLYWPSNINAFKKRITDRISQSAALSIVLNMFQQEFHEMASAASQLIEEVTAHAQSDGLEDARGICADSTYFPNNLRNMIHNGVSA